MNERIGAQRSTRSLEIIKWVLVSIFLIFAIAENYLCNDVAFTLRVFVAIVFVSMACGVALLTIKGRAMVLFMRHAYVEVKKVIWPSRQEALWTTFIVVTVVTVLSLILWGLDSILVGLVSFIIKLRF